MYPGRTQSSLPMFGPAPVSDGLFGVSNLGAPASTAAIWSTLVVGGVAAMFIAPTIVDTLIKSKVLGFNNRLSTKDQVKRSALVGGLIALPAAAIYGGVTYTAVRAM